MNRLSSLLNLRETQTNASLRSHFPIVDSWRAEVRRSSAGEGLCRQQPASLLWRLELGGPTWGALPEALPRVWASPCGVPSPFEVMDYLFDPTFALRDKGFHLCFPDEETKAQRTGGSYQVTSRKWTQALWYTSKCSLPSAHLPFSRLLCLSSFLPASLLHISTESLLCAQDSIR